MSRKNRCQTIYSGLIGFALQPVLTSIFACEKIIVNEPSPASDLLDKLKQLTRIEKDKLVKWQPSHSMRGNVRDLARELDIWRRYAIVNNGYSGEKIRGR